MTAIVALDTETTGLSLTDDIWEFAGIRREEDGTETELHLFIEHDEDKCAELPERFLTDHLARYDADLAVSQYGAATLIALFLAGKAHVVGCVPNFDTERIALLLRRFGMEPGWHHHVVCAEVLAVGYLKGIEAQRRFLGLKGGPVFKIPQGSWNSDGLSRRIGVEPPTDTRHTAMGDARWALQIYDRVMGTEPAQEASCAFHGLIQPPAKLSTQVGEISGLNVCEGLS
jgi:hypothetical protein